MAAHYRDELLHGKDHPDNHASANKWRHEESTAFAKHSNVEPRLADERHGSKDLAAFFSKSRVEGGGANGIHKPIVVSGNAVESARATEKQQLAQDGSQQDGVKTGAAGFVKCGPLLNYRRMENETWYGSVLIVTESRSGDEGVVPVLRLRTLAPIHSHGGVGSGHSSGNTNGNTGGTNGAHIVNNIDHSTNSNIADTSTGEPDQCAPGGTFTETKVKGVKLYADIVNTFWRFSLEVPMQEQEIQCEYNIPGLTFTPDGKFDSQHFFIPAINESMRIMFHSCNGFSVGTDEEAYSGACLWNDVMRQHIQKPFHVMLGGGDQIYNDGIRVHGPLRKWTDIANPKKRREYQFPEQLRRECDDYYVKNYIRWYSTEPFAGANGKIPQVNLWDDHDIIDGFGSYVDDFMKCPVFRGIGGVAHKYYLLFQHHIAPPASTFTTDAPATMSEDGGGLDPRQVENTYVLKDDIPDSSYIIGDKPGPYVAERSRSIYARLGARIAFFGIDARTERTRHQVNYPDTYNKIFTRLRAELSAARSSPSPIQHLVILLGIPIAYPRLSWLENIFASPLMGPLKFFNKRFGFGGTFFNKFDGSVDLLDDLDDHYTAHTHKKERQYIVEQLQALASEFSVRISILGGDVHLAAVGRFYSKPQLQIPASKDPRYMANIISSAIVNKPPPQAVANLLARRNKIHHLGHETDETLLNFFDQSPGNNGKTSKSNHATMPSRNWAMLTENSPISASTNGAEDTVEINGHTYELTAEEKPKDGHFAIHKGEVNAGTKHKSADYAKHGMDSDGSLDVVIRVEIDQHDKEGKTQGYGMTIPVLRYDGRVLVGKPSRVSLRERVRSAGKDSHGSGGRRSGNVERRSGSAGELIGGGGGEGEERRG